MELFVEQVKEWRTISIQPHEMKIPASRTGVYDKVIVQNVMLKCYKTLWR